MSKFEIGQAVTGAPDRDSHGWTGKIVGVESLQDGTPYYQVFWEERAKSPEHALSRAPVLGARPDHLRPRYPQS